MSEIWVTRMITEYDNMIELPDGIELYSIEFNKETGTCIGVFNCFIPFPKSSSALDLIPLIQFQFTTCYRTATASYPYIPPHIEILIGSQYLATTCIEELPSIKQWNVTTTIRLILQDIYCYIQNYQDGTNRLLDNESEDRLNDPSIYKSYEMKGKLFPCEVTIHGQLEKRIVVIQSARLLVCQRRGRQNIKVLQTIALTSLAKVTFKRYMSLTLYFKNQDTPQLYVTDDAEEIVQLIHENLRKSGVQGEFNDIPPVLASVNSQPPPLPVQQKPKLTKRSSSIKSKFFDTFGSISRYFTGSEESDQDSLASLQRDFFNNPNRAKVTQITKKYKAEADRFHSLKDDRNYANTLERLHEFIQHPVVQQILGANESKYVDRGIRVKSVS